MTLQDENDVLGLDDPEGSVAHEFEPLFGQLDEVRYFVTDDDVPYAVVIKTVNEIRLTLIYEMIPDRGLAWVFRSLDSAEWGDALWAENDGVIDVAESARESERAVLVVEDLAPYRVLKLLIFDEDLEEWRVFLVLHSELSIGEGDTLGSDSGDGGSHVSDPSLSVESDSDP